MAGVFVLSSGRQKEVLFRSCFWEVSNVFGLDTCAKRDKCDQGRCADGRVVCVAFKAKEVGVASSLFL
jgi:hypothetical protein